MGFVNEWRFSLHLFIYRLNWVMRTWWWWDEWDDTVLCTDNSKFEPWWSQHKHGTSRSRRFPTILNIYEWARKKYIVSLKPECHNGRRNPRSPTLQAGSFNHCTRPLAILLTSGLKCKVELEWHKIWNQKYVILCWNFFNIIIVCLI